LENFRPLKDCSCVIPCTSGAASDLKRHKEQDKVIKFLKGLNEQYASVRSQIMLLDLLPDIDRCFSLVLQQERQMLISTITDNYVDHQSSIMQVQQTTSNSGNNYSSFASAHHGGRGRGRGSHYMEVVVLTIEPALIMVDAIILLTHVLPYMAIHLVINIKTLSQ